MVIIVIGEVPWLRIRGGRRTEGWVDGRRPEEDRSHRGSRTGERAKNPAGDSRIDQEGKGNKREADIPCLHVFASSRVRASSKSSGGMETQPKQRHPEEREVYYFWSAAVIRRQLSVESN